MSSPASDHPQQNTLVSWAFALVVAAIYLQIYLSTPAFFVTMPGVGFALLGALYVCIGIFGTPFLDRNRHALSTYAYFGVQIALIAGILYVSPRKGLVSFVALPVTSQAFVLLRTRVAAVVTCLMFVIIYLCMGVPEGGANIVQSALGLVSAFAFVIIFTIVAQNEKKERIRREELSRELETANKKLVDYASRIQELAVMEERTRLAREIHDGLGHYLTVINIQIEAGKAMAAKDLPAGLELLNKAQKYAQEALADVRQSVRALRNSGRLADAWSLEKAIPGLIAQHATPGLDIQFRTQGAVRLLSANLEHNLYRFVQEGLTNIRKHAKADKVTIELDFRSTDKVRLQICDNGVGLPEKSEKGGGFASMSERATILGGTLASGNRQEGGFALSFEIPT